MFAVARAWAGSRGGLILIAGVAIVAGLGFNWSWLVAAGLAPLILSALPCVAMCALGLCAMQMGRKGAAPGPTNDSAQAIDSTLNQVSTGASSCRQMEKSRDASGS
jgi:hypothetical protein